jgi:hypothetical protein
MSNLPQLMQWRGPTAPPPQIKPADPNTLTLMREHMLNVHALLELTGVPTIYRWGRAVLERRSIGEVEREYFEPLLRQLQQLAAPGLLRLEAPQLRGAVPADYIAEGRRAPPVQAPQIDPEHVRKMLQAAGAPASPEDVAAQVAGRSVVLAAAALPPGLAGMTREAVKQLAAAAAAGFGVGGTGAAVARVAQGFPEEAARAFFEVGLASTAAADVANALKALAASVSAPQLRAATQQVLRRWQQAGLTWRDPEGEAFVKKIEDALLALKQGDASKYDQLLRQFEDWQKKIEEFNRLYEARQKGPLPPEDEARYTELLKEVSAIRDKYELLKQYIEAARGAGLEAGARRQEFESRTIEDLARAANEAPPGPPPRDLTQWLQRLDVDFLQRLVKDPNALARYARRFGVDEQTLAEQAAGILKSRQWENLANLPNEELRKVLMDGSMIKKYASELGVDEDKLRTLIEEMLQQRLGLAPPKTEPERPPIEPIRRPKPPEAQHRPPEAEVAANGQALIVRAKEEPKPTAARLDNLPDVQTRLRRILRRRLKEEEPPEVGLRGTETLDRSVSTNDRSADVQTDKNKQTDRQTADSTAVANKTADTSNTTATTTATTSAGTTTAASDRVVVTTETLRAIIPALPAYVFSMPALTVLSMISQVVGAPIALAPGIPRPAPRESFANWLDRVFAGSGFSWRSLASQRETFVFA